MSGSRSGRRHGWERERWKERQEREKKRDRDEREKDKETGENEKKLQKQKKSWNFILSYFTPQNGVKHDKCRATIHCPTSIRLPETRWERKR